MNLETCTTAPQLKVLTPNPSVPSLHAHMSQVKCTYTGHDLRHASMHLVDVFVALGYSHIGLGVGHVGIFVGTHIGLGVGHVGIFVGTRVTGSFPPPL
jgi:hypothetical protein